MLRQPKELAAERAELLGDRRALHEAAVEDAHRRPRERNPAAVQIGDRLGQIRRRVHRWAVFAFRRLTGDFAVPLAAAFSASRALTSLFTSATGSGLSAEKRIVPLLVS